MSYLITILGTLLLLLGFVLWSWFETRQGFRVFAGPRKRLDREAARTAFILRHIDWGAFVAHVGKSAAARVAHDIVHSLLLMVRASERTLTRAIRSLRTRVASHEASGEPVEGSQLIATLVRFRKNLRRTRDSK
ncbi:MAG: hypothetical protein ACM3TU_00295 [Bacillota bacterium]